MTKSLAKELREVPNFTNVYVTNDGTPIIWRAQADGTLTPQHVKKHYGGYYVVNLKDDNGVKQSV